jgi:hypothetical protein
MATTVEQIDELLSVPKEHQQLEFKAAKNGYDYEKLCKYCVAMANEGGGTILLGVTDTLPRSVVGSNAYRDVTKITEQLYQKLRFRVDVDEIVHPGGRVVVFHVPSRPIGSAYELGGAYFMRSGSQLVPMSPDRLRTIFAEIPAATSINRSREELVRDAIVWRDDRLQLITANNGPLPCSPSNAFVVHIIPLEALSYPFRYSVATLRNQLTNLPPMNSSGWGDRLNFDGLLTYISNSSSTSYVQLFRSGAIESVDCELICTEEHGRRLVDLTSIEYFIIRATTAYLNCLAGLGANPPVLFLLTLFGGKGAYWNGSDFMFPLRIHPLDRDTLTIPEVSFDNLSAPVPQILRPAFNSMWSAFGKSGSPNYDDSGNWTEHR